MRELILGGLALATMTVSTCAGGSDPMTCSSKEASDTLRDLIQTKVIAPVVEDVRKQDNDAIAQGQKIVEVEKKMTDAKAKSVALGMASIGECAKEHPNDTTAQGQCMQEMAATLNDPDGLIAKVKAAAADIDTAPILFEVQNIITTDKTDYKATCKATIHWSGGDGWWVFPTNDDPFTFEVEKTDDGKLYVTERGLDQSLK